MPKLRFPEFRGAGERTTETLESVAKISTEKVGGQLPHSHEHPLWRWFGQPDGDLSDNYDTAARKELGKDHPKLSADDRSVPLAIFYKNNPKDIPTFEKQMRRKTHHAIQPQHLWNSIASVAITYPKFLKA